MAYEIIYLEKTKASVKESRTWYNVQRKGLGKIFAAAVKEAIVRLQKNPEAYAIRYRNVRIAHTYKFPFSIHFYIDMAEKLIVVTNIIHDYREVE